MTKKEMGKRKQDICLLVYDLCDQRYPKYQINEIFVAIFKAIRILLRQNFKGRSINLGTFEEGNSKNKKNIFPFQGKKQSAQGKRKLVFDQADI